MLDLEHIGKRMTRISSRWAIAVGAPYFWQDSGAHMNRLKGYVCGLWKKNIFYSSRTGSALQYWRVALRYHAPNLVLSAFP